MARHARNVLLRGEIFHAKTERYALLLKIFPVATSMLESSSVQLRKDVCLNLMCDLTLKRLKERKNALHLSRIYMQVMMVQWQCQVKIISQKYDFDKFDTTEKVFDRIRSGQKIPPSNYHLLALRKFTIWFDTRLHISHSGFTAICTLSSLLSWQKTVFVLSYFS